MTRPRSTTRNLVEELGNRPAMNGGWQRLAAQQDEQCDRLVVVETTVKDLGTRLAALERPLKWIGRGVGAVFLALVVRLILDGIAHFHFVVQ